MTLYTIGFTNKSAEQFFTLLSQNQVQRVIDVRLHATSQLSGFAKKNDLQYFLRTICEIDYCHMEIFAPTKAIFEAYKKNEIDWKGYEQRFLNLMAQRNTQSIDSNLLNNSCLLCSEHKPEHCHRRLVAEYLSNQLGSINVVHLV